MGRRRARDGRRRPSCVRASAAGVARIRVIECVATANATRSWRKRVDRAGPRQQRRQNHARDEPAPADLRDHADRIFVRAARGCGDAGRRARRAPAGTHRPRRAPCDRIRYPRRGDGRRRSEGADVLR